MVPGGGLQQEERWNRLDTGLNNISSLHVSSVESLSPVPLFAMDCSMPGFPVHHQLPEVTQTHVRGVGDAIQPSHLLSSPSHPTFNLSQHQGLFKESVLRIRCRSIGASTSASISPSNKYSGLISFRME